MAPTPLVMGRGNGKVGRERRMSSTHILIMNQYFWKTLKFAMEVNSLRNRFYHIVLLSRVIWQKELPAGPANNLWGPVQNENRGLLFKKRPIISRWWEQSIEPSRSPMRLYRLPVPEVALMTTKAQISEERVIQGFIMVLRVHKCP